MFVTGTNQQALAAQAALCMMAMMAMTAVAQQGQPYQATPESAAKTQQALRAAGLRNVPGPRKDKARKPTADEICKAKAARLGYRNGVFVGC